MCVCLIFMARLHNSLSMAHLHTSCQVSAERGCLGTVTPRLGPFADFPLALPSFPFLPLPFPFSSYDSECGVQEIGRTPTPSA